MVSTVLFQITTQLMLTAFVWLHSSNTAIVIGTQYSGLNNYTDTIKGIRTLVLENIFLDEKYFEQIKVIILVRKDLTSCSNSILTYKVLKEKKKVVLYQYYSLLIRFSIFLKEVLLLCHTEKFSYIIENSEQFIHNSGLKFLYYQRNHFLKMKILRILENKSKA